MKHATAVIALVLVAGLPQAAAGQSDPAGFGTVISIGEFQSSPFISGSIGSDTQLNVYDKGRVIQDFDAGPADGTGFNIEVNLYDGIIEPGFDAYAGTMVNVLDGRVGSNSTAHSGSTVAISGGLVGEEFDALSGSIIAISGGRVRPGFTSRQGSTMYVTGGELEETFRAFGEVYLIGGFVGPGFVAHPGSTLVISGGTIADGISILPGSAATLAGSAFQLNGIGASDASTGIPSGSTDLLTGVYADGSMFLFAGELGDEIAANTMTLQIVAAVPSENPGTLSSGTFSKGVRPGESLTVTGNGELEDNFTIISGTLNIEGGLVGEDLEIANSEVNISGGNVGKNGSAFGASTINVNGGWLGNGFHAYSGTIVNIAGGRVGTGLSGHGGSTINITGGEIDDFVHALAGSVVNILGGEVGRDFEAASGSIINISGGMVGRDFEAEEGSTVNISGGRIGIVFDADTGSVVNLSGGMIEGAFDAHDGSTINISGGTPGYGFEAYSGSTVVIAGGRIGGSFQAYSGSSISFNGTDFQFYGSTVGALAGGFGGAGSTDLFTGLLEDGTVFLLAGEGGDELAAGAITLQSEPVAASENPGILSSGTFGKGIRAGEALTVTGSGQLDDNFAIVGGTLNMEGGSTGRIKSASSTINLSGGTVDRLNAFADSIINVSGGTIANFSEANDGSTINVSGGTIGDHFDAHDGSIINISGGTIEPHFEALPGSTVNISGGTFVRDFIDGFEASSGSSVHIAGSSFSLDGVPVTGLVPGEAFVLNDRDVVLTGILADGTPFDFILNPGPFVPRGEDFFSQDGLLTLTLVPPSLPGDFDGDGDVDGVDIAEMFTNFNGPGGGVPANPDTDLDGDGDVDGVDIAALFGAFTGPLAPANVPEPAGFSLLALGGMFLMRRRG